MYLQPRNTQSVSQVFPTFHSDVGLCCWDPEERPWPGALLIIKAQLLLQGPARTVRKQHEGFVVKHRGLNLCCSLMPSLLGLPHKLRLI